MIGYHFISAHQRLGYADNRRVEPGVKLEMKEVHYSWGYVYRTPQVCRAGMHCSINPLHAFSYKPYPIMCKVNVTGQLDFDNDKFCGRYREVIWMKDVTYQLWQLHELIQSGEIPDYPIPEWKSEYNVLQNLRAALSVYDKINYEKAFLELVEDVPEL